MVHRTSHCFLRKTNTTQPGQPEFYSSWKARAHLLTNYYKHGDRLNQIQLGSRNPIIDHHNQYGKLMEIEMIAGG